MVTSIKTLFLLPISRETPRKNISFFVRRFAKIVKLNIFLSGQINEQN